MSVEIYDLSRRVRSILLISSALLILSGLVIGIGKEWASLKMPSNLGFYPAILAKFGLKLV